jgi:hypothetical protein
MADSGSAYDTRGSTSGILAGAALGGVAWGLLAARTIGASRSDTLWPSSTGRYLVAAAAVTVLCLVASTVLWPSPDAPRAMRRRQLAIVLVTAPVGGWAYLFLQFLQY